MFRTKSAAIAGVALACAGPAWGQAFTQAKGEGRVITSVTWSNSSRIFDDDARTADIPGYDQLNVYFIGEYGATDDLTLLLTPSFRSVQVRGASDSTGLGYTDVGARYRVAKGERFVVSLQGLARIPGMSRRDVLAQIGQTDMEYDLRAQGAVTFGKGQSAASA